MNLLELVRHHAAGERGRRLAKRLTKLAERQPRRADQAIGCLLWQGAKNRDGYPKMNFTFEGRKVQAYVHHVTLCLFMGEDVPKGMERDHTCNTRHCIEPRCMEVVTHKVNQQRAKERRFAKWTYAQALEQMREQA